MQSILRVLFAIACMGGVFACTTTPPAANPPPPAAASAPGPLGIGGGPRDDSEAMLRTSEGAKARVVEAHCWRAVRCGDVGEGESFETFDDCLANFPVLHAEDFVAFDCASGIRPDTLSSCLSAIEEEVCGSTARYPSCTSIGMCNSI
jgi:hypothetical protein